MNESYGTRSLREIIRILCQHWFMLMLIVAVGTAGTWFYCDRYAKPQYRSRVSLMFKRPLNRSPISTDGSERALEVFVKAQQQIVMSDLVLARAKVISEDAQLRKEWLKLRDRWRTTMADPTSEEARKTAKRKVLAFLTGRENSPGSVAYRVNELLTKRQKDFKQFAKSVELETPGGEQVAMTESFTLIVDRPGPREEPESHLNAMYAADLLADMYMIRYQTLQEDLSAPAVAVLDDVIEAYREEVRNKVGSYESFVKANAEKIGVLEQLMKSGTEHGVQIFLTKIRENTARLTVELEWDRAVYKALDALLPASMREPGAIDKMTEAEVVAAIESVPVDFLEENVVFVELTKNLAKLEAKRVKLQTQFLDESRDVKYVLEELDRAKRRLLAAVIAQAKGLKTSIQAREEQLAANQTMLEANLAVQNEMHALLAEYAQKKSEFTAAEKHLADLQRDKIDAIANSTRAREAVTISKLNEASVPDRERPLSPKTLLYTIVAGLVSTLLAVAFAFMLDHFDHTLRSSVDAERYLGVPVLGSVKKRGRRLVVAT